MSVRVRLFIGATTVLMVATFALTGCVDAPSETAPAAESEEAPVLAGPALYEFYTEWCPGCQAMDPVVDTIESEYSAVIRIHRFDVERDSEAHELMRSLRQGYVPAFYIVDESGRITDQWVGQRTEDEMRAALDRVISGAAAADDSAPAPAPSPSAGAEQPAPPAALAAPAAPPSTPAAPGSGRPPQAAPPAQAPSTKGKADAATGAQPKSPQQDSNDQGEDHDRD